MGSDTPKRPAPNNGGKTAAGAVTKPVSPDDAVLKGKPTPKKTKTLRMPYAIARRIAFVFDPDWKRWGRTCVGWIRWGDVSFRAFRIAWGPV
jgi:hypothetical protein